MDAHSLTKIAQRGETTIVEFKQEYHKNKAELVHDLLCLANAVTPQKNKRLLAWFNPG